jgi:hypothetical protein
MRHTAVVAVIRHPRASKKKKKDHSGMLSLECVCSVCRDASFHTSPSALLPYLSPIARILNLFFCRLFVSVFISYFLFLSIY